MKYEVEDNANATGEGITVDTTMPPEVTLRQDVEEAAVLSYMTLTNPGSMKGHIEIKLPTSIIYRAGHCLPVLPFHSKTKKRRKTQTLLSSYKSHQP